MIPLTFTTPADSVADGKLSPFPVAEYGAQVLDQFGVQAEVPIWADSLGKVPVVPKAAGNPERVWLWLAEDWRARLFVVFSKDKDGNVSGPSNAVMVAAGPAVTSDVYWYVGASLSVGQQAKYSERTIKPLVRMVAWRLLPGSWDPRPSFGGPATSKALEPYGAIVRDYTIQRLAIECSCKDGDWP